MKLRFKRIIAIGVIICVSPLLYVGGTIGLAAVTEYKPLDVEPAAIVKTAPGPSTLGETFTLTTYNVGYGGMGSKQDFFMDGGTMSRAISADYVRTSLDGVVDTLKTTQSNVIFVQEADQKATRSHEIDEVQVLSEALSTYNATFAVNYDVKWVPVPWTNPMGGVKAGLMTFSDVKPTETTRFQLPGYESIPTRYADLKRCVMVNTYPTANGKTAYLINVHLSAFDKGGFIRSQQMTWLIDYLKKTYNPDKNYIILGGDWNQLLSKDLLAAIKEPIPEWIAVLPDTINETNFKVVYDKEHSTVRSAEKPYVKGENFETTIDGFMVSPNVEVVSVEAVETDYKDSDHKPVTAVFKLN